MINVGGNALSLDSAQIDGGVHAALPPLLSGAELQQLYAVGEVRALGTHITIELALRGATLINPGGNALSLDSAQIDGGAFLEQVRAVGQVGARGTHIAGGLALQGAI